MPLFTSAGLGLCYFGLGLAMVVRIWSCLHHCHTPYSWWGLLPPPQELHPALSVRAPFSALRTSLFSSLFQQSSFPPMHSGLDKTLAVPIFGAKECIRTHDFVLKMYKNSGCPDPRSGKGKILFAPTRVPTCQMLVPSASSRLATALA